MDQSNVYPRFRWFIMMAAIVATAAQTAMMIAPAPLMGPIAKDLGMSVGQATGIIMGLWQIAAPISVIASGFYVDRYGITKTMALGCALLILPSLAFPFVDNNLGAIVALRVLQAFGVGPISAAVAPLAAIWFPPQQRSFVAGLQGMANSLGVAISFMLSPVIFAVSGNWLTVMPWMTIVAVVALVLTLAIPFGSKPPSLAVQITGCDSVAGKDDFKLALKQPVTYVGIAALFIGCWTFVAFNDLTPGYFAIESPVGLGFGPEEAGKLMTIYQLAFMAGAVAVAVIFEKVFKENARLTISIGFGLFAVFATSIMLPAVYANKSVLMICLPLAGFFGAWCIPVCITFISLHYPAHITGKMIGLWFGVGIFAGLPAIIAGSAALHTTGNYHMSIIIVAAVALLGIIVAMFMKPPTVFCIIEKGNNIQA